jgi:heterotetrameric sarcosine oxidase delta subunit
MLITCPYCGPRDVAEFTYQGDGNRTRPDPASTDIATWNAYIFDRVNIAGEHNEIWQHSGGCRSHLAVVRNTLTHLITSVRMVRKTAPAPLRTAKAPAAKAPAKSASAAKSKAGAKA